MSKVIAVTGKGGTGKTTSSALIIKALKEIAEGTVLAIDADPDANLTKVLGVPVEMSIGDLREETLKEMKDFPAGMDKRSYIESGLHQIITETEKIDYITMGRSEGPGCYCYINSLLRKFSDDLQESYDWVVMDNEAGLEHLSRRTASKVDALIAVVNNTPLSIDCVARIQDLLAGITNEIKKKYIIINDVSEERLEIVRERCKHLDMEIIGSIPNDPEVEEAIFNGKSILELGDTPASLKMKEIVNIIKEL